MDGWERESPASLDEPPLIVDLDGTLLKTDMLVECFFHLLSQNPLKALTALAALRHGKAALKARLAELGSPQIDTLPVNETVLAFLISEKGRGRRIYLATAADRRLAEKVASHFGLFDGVFASENGVNLSGKVKADALCDEFGEGGFDYIGDARIDFSVWAKARRVLLAEAAPTVEKAARKRFPNLQVISSRSGSLSDYLRALRPHQWLKNLLVLIPLLAAHKAGAAAIDAGLAFISFSLCASGVYLLNDLLDLQADRRHVRKRLRPFASGAIPLARGALMLPALLAGALSIAWFLPPEFLLVLCGYFALTLAYSLLLKRRQVADVVVLACLYGARFAAGSAATGIHVSGWLMALSIFLFFSLALIKRCSELIDRRAAGAGDPPGRAYRLDDLPLLEMMSAASGYVAVLVLALYVSSPAVKELYRYPQMLWASCVLLLFWISRVLLLTHRGVMHDDPVVFAATDRVSLVCCGAMGALMIACL